MNQTFSEYVAYSAMNCSTLMHGFDSMLALHDAIQGDYPEPTPGMIFGADYHKLILEPDEFRRTYRVMPNYAADEENVDSKGKPSSSWSTTWAKERKAEFLADCERNGLCHVTRENYDKGEAMLAALQSKPFIRDMIDVCAKESTLLGEIDGVEFKARIDLLADTHLADLKGTNSVNPRLFGSSCARLHYVERMSVYRELARQNGKRIDEAFLLAVETSKPFDCAVFVIRELVLDQAFEKVRRLLERYKQCLAHDDWPGVDEGAPFLELHIPNWAMDDDALVAYEG